MVGRGFGLMHDHATGEDRAVDSAEHPWTLDNPAHGWFGLSSAVRIRVGDAHPRGVGRRGRRARRRAPPRTARDLMVALVRAGVTATCSAADAPPLRPPRGRLQPARRPHRPRRPGGQRLHRRGARRRRPRLRRRGEPPTRRTGQARVFVPAAAPLDAVWVPDADLRGVLDLPVLIVAGDGGGRRAVVADLDDAEIAVNQDAPARLRGVRVAHRRTDQPRRARLRRRARRHPARIADALLHRLAVRGVDRPAASARPPTGRTSSCSTGATPSTSRWSPVPATGGISECPRAVRNSTTRWCRWPSTGRRRACPPTVRCSPSNPAGAVQLAALKPRGNPTATGSAAAVDPADVTRSAGRNPGRAQPMSRLSTSAGSTDRAVVSADLLEAPAAPTATPLQPARLPDRHRCAPMSMSTRSIDADRRALAPDAEAAQPLYARYWLHNRGPGTAGRAARRRAPAPRDGRRPARRHGAAAADRGQRLQRRHAERRGRGCATRRAGASTTRHPDVGAGSTTYDLPARAATATPTSPSPCPPTPRPATTRCAPNSRSAATCRRPGARPSRTSASSPSASRASELVRLVAEPRRRRRRTRRRRPAERHRRLPTRAATSIWRRT